VFVWQSASGTAAAGRLCGSRSPFSVSTAWARRDCRRERLPRGGKNLLANVQATVKLSQSETTDGLKDAIEGRIRALANVHSLFVETRWIGAELSTIATQELAPYSREGETRRVRIEGPQVLLKPDIAQAIAVILHELATNAAKYGALSTGGVVELNWSHEADGRLILRWIELGGPVVQTPTKQGFGTRGAKVKLGGQAALSVRQLVSASLRQKKIGAHATARFGEMRRNQMRVPDLCA
jgi:two-component sensor histidine kinase